MFVEIAVFTVLFLVVRIFFNRSREKPCTPGIPKAIFPTYSILRTGLSDLRGGTVWKLLHFDILQTFGGFAALYPKESILEISIGLGHFVLLTKAKSVEEFLLSKVPTTRLKPEVFAPWFGNSFTMSIGHEWKSKRKPVMPVFRDCTLQINVPKFDQHSKVLVDILKKRQNEEWTDIRSLAELYTLNCTWEMAFGAAMNVQTLNGSEYVSAMVRAAKAVTKRVFNPILYWDFLFRKTALGNQFYKDVSFLRGFIKQVIKQRKTASTKQNGRANHSYDHRDPGHADLLTLLLEFHMKNPDFTEEDITDEIAAFIFGSQDTTAAAVSWTLYLVGLHPDIQSKIHEELDSIFGNACDKPLTIHELTQMRYLESVWKPDALPDATPNVEDQVLFFVWTLPFNLSDMGDPDSGKTTAGVALKVIGSHKPPYHDKECQRLYPSIPLNGRRVLQDFYLNGHKIKKGNTVIVCQYVLHRDPEVFPNPEIFDPNRFLPENCLGRGPFSYIPFSAGGRSCLGRRFAMVENKIVLANILRNFCVKSLDHRDKILTSVDFVLHSINSLKLKFTQRHNNVDCPVDEA